MARLMHGRRPAPAASLLLAVSMLSACATLPEIEPQTVTVIDASLRSGAEQAEAAHDYPAAAEQYRTLLSRHPQDVSLALTLGRMLRYAGKPQEAAELMKSVIARQGKSAPVLAELGKDYLAADQLPLAVSILGEARDLAPQDWQHYSALGVAYDYQEKSKEAQEAYRAGLAVSPGNPVLLNNLGLSQAQAGGLDEAIATFRQAVDSPQATAQMRQNLALLLALKGDLNGAERMARKDLPPEVVRDNVAYFKMLNDRVRTE